VLALILALGCDSSDKSKGGDAGGDGGGEITETPGCTASLVGTWTMASVSCGGADVTASIGIQGGITEMRLQIADSGTSCAVVATTTGPTCVEARKVTLNPAASGSYAVVDQGITDCQPAQCAFNASDAPCKLGDRASEASTSSLDVKDGTLTVTSPPPSGLCGGYGVATIISYTKS
jgi:hypothetical protein